MTDDAGSRMRAGSERGIELVARWNAGDRAWIMGQLADDFVLEARRPKIPSPRDEIVIRSKTAFRLGLLTLPLLPRFVIVNALEDAHTICLVIEDPDRHLLAVTIEINEEGKFSKIVSFRPER